MYSQRIKGLFRELGELCILEPGTPRGEVPIKEEGVIGINYLNKTSDVAIVGSGTHTQKVPGKKTPDTTAALINAWVLINAVHDAHLIERTIQDPKALLLAMARHKYSRRNPFMVGENVTVSLDKNDDVRVEFKSSATEFTQIESLKRAIEDAKQHNLHFQDKYGSYVDGARPDIRKAFNARHREAESVMRIIKDTQYRKDPSRNVHNIAADVGKLTAEVLKKSELFFPITVGDPHGNLGIRLKGTRQILPIDEETFKPVDVSLQPKEYEWVFKGKEILTRLANEGVNFPGASDFITKTLP
jgi:hypothetical protein